MIRGGANKNKGILDLGAARGAAIDMQGGLQLDQMPNYPGDPMNVSGGGDGWNFTQDGFKGKTMVAQFVLVTEYADYLLCSFQTEKVYVAKPPTLRISYYTAATYDGKDFTQQDVNEMLVEDAVGSESDETWLVTPDYVAGDLITAINFQDVIQIAGPETYWQEINSCRSWAVES